MLLTCEDAPVGEVYINGVELERPFEVKLFNVASVAFSERKLTVSVRESSLNKGKRPSDTASSMQGSSPFIKFFDSVFSGFWFNL